ncbi:hypothetical protein [Mycobacterium sp. SMC-4]|uniref:hypothetical protein n=1 Tax=Mycobacterium sp. SMC-4 TaxID=2857059 RepID=UPI003D015B5E
MTRILGQARIFFDDRAYRAIRTAIRTAWPAVPAVLKWYPEARTGGLRELGWVPRTFTPGRPATAAPS